MKSSQKYLALGVIAIVAALVGVLLARIVLPGATPSARRAPTLASGTLLQPPRVLPNFSLIDQDKQPFDVSRLRGHWSLVFFGFTNCGDVCPTTLTLLAAMHQKLVDLPSAAQPHVVFVSVDVARDTPDVLKSYLVHFDPSFIGVTGTQQEIDKLTLALGVPAQVTRTADGGYNVDHSAAILAINPRGEYAALFSAPHTLEGLTPDYRTLVASSQ